MNINRRIALISGFSAAGAMPFIKGVNAADAAPPVLSAAPAPDDLGRQPVLFWNGIALELVALDHSIVQGDARAPGPAATAYALGLIHAVIADAVALAYPSPGYSSSFSKNPVAIGADEQSRNLFVGGAAWGIMSFIYDSASHSYVLGIKREEYISRIGRDHLRDWRFGTEFGRSSAFTSKWSAADVIKRVSPATSVYLPNVDGRSDEHDVDPYNPGQGFYGSQWGSQPPLVVEPQKVDSLGPDAPPKFDIADPNSTYSKDIALLKVKGALISNAAGGIAARTQEETQEAYFWAYDGSNLIGTPPRLYNQILRTVALKDGLSIPEMARMFAICNLGMADAGIVAWFSKYRHKIWSTALAFYRRLDPTWKALGSPRTNLPGFSLSNDVRDTAQAFIAGAVAALSGRDREQRG